MEIDTELCGTVMNIQIDREQLIDVLKCQNDPCYFVNTHILNGNGDDVQLRMIKELHEHTSTMSPTNFCQEAIAVYLLWYALFHSNKTMCYSSRNLTNSKKFINHVRKMYSILPEYIVHQLKYNNNSYIEFSNNSAIQIAPSTDNSLRGRVINLLCFDNFSEYRESVKDHYKQSYQHLSTYVDKIIYNN